MNCTLKKNLTLILLSCLLLLSWGLLTACDSGNTPTDTTAEATPADTPAPTDPDAGAHAGAARGGDP